MLLLLHFKLKKVTTTGETRDILRYLMKKWNLKQQLSQLILFGKIDLYRNTKKSLVQSNLYF